MRKQFAENDLNIAEERRKNAFSGTEDLNKFCSPGAGIRLIATNCIGHDTLFPAYEKLQYVSQETYDTWFRGHLAREMSSL